MSEQKRSEIRSKFQAMAEQMANVATLPNQLILLDKQKEDALLKYNDLLTKYSEKIDLVAPASAEDNLKRHILDSLAAALSINSITEVDNSTAVLDVGSGAGLPGIPLAILWPEANVILCEPREKRALFLKETIRRLGLGNAQVFSQRLEALDPMGIPAINICIERALGDQELLLKYIPPLMPEGGFIIQMGGPSWELKKGCENRGNTTFWRKVPYSQESQDKRALAVWRCFT